mgnify:CR=1 FL=1
MLKRVHGSCLVVLLATGCAPKEESSNTPEGFVPDPGDAVVLDTSRGPIFSEYPNLGTSPGLVGVPNIDDDDRDGQVDWVQEGNAIGENDFAIGSVVTHGRKVELTLQGAGIRVYDNNGLLLDGANSVVLIDSDIDFWVEYEQFLTQGRLTIRDVSRDDEFAVVLTASPLFLNHHLQDAVETMSVVIRGGGGYDNNDFINGYEAELGNAFWGIPGSRYDYDPWVQDEFEFGYAVAPDATLNVIFDTHRNGQGAPGEGLDDVPEDEYLDADWAIVNWGRIQANSLDYGGNLEVSPPVTVDGVDYPYGRIYYGGAPGYLPHQATRTALDDMLVQKPFMGDSTWLCVGHIDEFVSTIPDSESPKGFRFVIADTRSAWALLESMNPNTRLPRYSPGGWSGHSIDDVGEILSDRSLRNLNDEVQDILDDEKARFMNELGLDEADVVYMPSLFEEPPGYRGCVAALIPGMVNLVVSTSDDGPVAFLADPFLRSDLNDQNSDPMIAYVRDIFPADLKTVFLDDWDVYHMGLGEVHCASNVLRTPPRSWWEDAGHLLEED